MMIETEHLSLAPWTPAQLLALMAEPVRFEQVMGLPAATGLREMFVSDDVSQEWLSELRGSSGPDPWRHGFLIIDREAHQVVGSAAFKGPPDSAGVVEIAYGIAPPFEGRGYATEAAAALIGYALESGLVEVIRAHTLPSNAASQRVLIKTGFKYVGDVNDPDDGLVSRWERGR